MKKKKTFCCEWAEQNQYANKESQHDRLIGIAMSLIEGVFEVREDKHIDGEEYYELEDEIISVLKANKVK